MKVLVRVPWRAGSASYSGACRMVKPGSISSTSSSPGRRNMLKANRLCHALGVITRTARR
jgi:hypothetical protein